MSNGIDGAMQDAMTLTRSVSQLTSVYTTVDPPFFARTASLSSEWQVRVEDALEDAKGNTDKALLALGLNLSKEQKEKYAQQALKRSYDDWCGGADEPNEREVEEGDPPPVGEEESTELEKGSISAPVSSVFGSVDSGDFFQFFSHAFAHPIQYGEDLRLAAARGENEKVEQLIRRGCNPNAGDGMGWTALHHAAQYGFVRTIECIVETHGRENIALDQPDSKGWTPFYNAIANSEKACAQKLIDYGASSSISSYYGRNALHVAAMKGLDEMVRYLTALDKSLMEGKDQAGWTPLFCAVQHDELNIVKVLVASGCNIHATDKLGKTATAYGDDLAEATVNQTEPASPRSARKDDEEA